LPEAQAAVAHAAPEAGQSASVAQATQVPPEHTGSAPEQAGPASCQKPFTSHVCGWLAEHRSAPGTQTPAPASLAMPVSPPPPSTPPLPSLPPSPAPPAEMVDPEQAVSPASGRKQIVTTESAAK
jgi:hypothetical protein